jgi:predicted dehydrogenase
MNSEVPVEKLRTILIGTGFWGRGWAKVIAESPDASIAALVDLDEETLEAVGKTVGVDKGRQFSRVEQAFDNVEADAAIIVVPPEQHHEVAMAALAAGLHCVIEKPFAPTLPEAREVVSAAEDAQRKLMISQTFRFRRGARTVQKLIRDGAIGQVGAVHGRLFKYMHFTGFRATMPEPLIVDQAVHHFDFVRGIFGLEPVRVRGYSFNPPWSYFKGNANALVEFETADGAFISYSGSWVSMGGPQINTSIDGSWDIQGDGGAIQWNHNYVRLVPTDFADVVYRKGALEREAQVLEIPLDVLAAEERAGVLDEFIKAVREDRKPETDGKDNLRSLALVLGAVESCSQDGKWVNLA